MRYLRYQLYAHLQTLPLAFFTSTKTARYSPSWPTT